MYTAVIGMVLAAVTTVLGLPPTLRDRPSTEIALPEAAAVEEVPLSAAAPNAPPVLDAAVSAVLEPEVGTAPPEVAAGPPPVAPAPLLSLEPLPSSPVVAAEPAPFVPPTVELPRPPSEDGGAPAPAPSPSTSPPSTSPPSTPPPSTPPPSGSAPPPSGSAPPADAPAADVPLRVVASGYDAEGGVLDDPTIPQGGLPVTVRGGQVTARSYVVLEGTAATLRLALVEDPGAGRPSGGAAVLACPITRSRPALRRAMPPSEAPPIDCATAVRGVLEGGAIRFDLGRFADRGGDRGFALVPVADPGATFRLVFRPDPPS